METSSLPLRTSDYVQSRRPLVTLCPLLLAALLGCGDDAADRRIVVTPGSMAGTTAAPPAMPCGTPGAGFLSCGGVCTDVKSDRLNCGGCGKSCGTGTCAAGSCVCPANSTMCAGACADLATSVTNCGGCGKACSANQLCLQGVCASAPPPCVPACGAGQTCTNGVCTCPPGMTFCGDACLDTNTTPMHCGGCNRACLAGQLCSNGACACPPGQMQCGMQCVDVQTNQQNCGMCGKACATGEACMAGVCRSPMGMDGCSGGPARDLSIKEVAAYQSIKIPLSRGATAIEPAMRLASVVAGRDTLFRVFVGAASSFAAREFSARVTIKNGTSEDQYFAKQRISMASTDADSANTFQVFVPKDKVGPETRYSVELVECASAAMSGGAAADTRLPATGDLPLSARQTGTLKITIIPVATNSRMPDTTDNALKVYREYLEAIYPVTKVELTVGKSISTAYPVNWTTMLEQIRSQRSADRPAADMYYYGWVKPADDLRTYCQRGCTAGVGYVGNATQGQTRAAVGLAFGDEMSAATMAHEVGHNHGRNHAPCAPGGQIAGVDSKYPHSGASVGVWGYDPRRKTFLNPMNTKDIMSYCDPKWVSDYTYKGWTDRVAAINGNMLVIADETAIQRYQVMVVDADGPRWSQPFPEPAEAFGEAESADIVDIDGNPVDHVTVYRTQFGDHEAATILVPPPQPRWHAIQLRDASSLPFAAPITVPDPI